MFACNNNYQQFIIIKAGYLHNCRLIRIQETLLAVLNVCFPYISNWPKLTMHEIRILISLLKPCCDLCILFIIYANVPCCQHVKILNNFRLNRPKTVNAFNELSHHENFMPDQIGRDIHILPYIQNISELSRPSRPRRSRKVATNQLRVTSI